MSNIGNIRIDFQVIESGDPKFLLVGDFSSWKVIEDLPANLEVIPPGSHNKVSNLFQKNQINGLNSLNLGLSQHQDCEENYLPLPDGIYELCLRGGANGERMKKRYYLKKDQFQLDFDKMKLKLGIEYDVRDQAYREVLIDIMIYSEAASSATRRGEIKEAKYYFDIATDLLTKYKDCKNCI